MNIETLRVFCNLAKLRSFSRTAEKHYLSQSAISQQLAQLELTHKCQLINRKKRPIELTEEGLMLYKASKDIIDRFEQFKSELNSLTSSANSKIHVAAIFSIGMHALPSYIKEFMVKYPNVNVDMVYLDATAIYEQVLAGDVDIGIVAVPKKVKRLEVYDFQDEPLVLACSPKHIFASQDEIDIHHIQFERFISFAQNIPTRIWIDGILQRYNIEVQPALEFDNIETIKRAVEINSGISILPESAIVQERKNGTIRALKFSNERFVRPTGIIVRKNRVLNPVNQYFIDLLCETDGLI